jgi:hypothetical protein
MIPIKTTCVALSLAIMATHTVVTTGCMKMDNMTTTVTVAESGFDPPLSIPTILSPKNLARK